MKVLVTRGAGDKLAPEVIFDVLCNVQSVGVERGKSYLYDEGFNKRLYEVKIPYRGIVYPSDLVTVYDGSVGEGFVGRVISHVVSITQEDGAVSVDSTITVERSEII